MKENKKLYYTILMLRIIIHILILFFAILISYQLFLVNCDIIEGMDSNTSSSSSSTTKKQKYKPYDTTNPANALILAQQNAGNIGYINERMDNVQDMSKQIVDLSNNVQDLQTQMNGLASAQQQYATQLTGGSAPTITGATTSTATDDEDENDTS